MYICKSVLRELIECEGNTIRYFELFRTNLYWCTEGNEADIKHLEDFTIFFFFNHKKFYDAYIQDFVYLFSYLYYRHNIRADEKKDFINSVLPAQFDRIERNIESFHSAFEMLNYLGIEEI